MKWEVERRRRKKYGKKRSKGIDEKGRTGQKNKWNAIWKTKQTNSKLKNETSKNKQHRIKGRIAKRNRLKTHTHKRG